MVLCDPYAKQNLNIPMYLCTILPLVFMAVWSHTVGLFADPGFLPANWKLVEELEKKKL